MKYMLMSTAVGGQTIHLEAKPQARFQRASFTPHFNVYKHEGFTS